MSHSSNKSTHFDAQDIDAEKYGNLRPSKGKHAHVETERYLLQTDEN